MIKVKAYQICESFDIKKIKQVFTDKIVDQDAIEVLFEIESLKYLYIFKYGVVCFLGYNDEEITKSIDKISVLCNNPFEEKIFEEYCIEQDSNINEIGYQKIITTTLDSKILKLIMLNLSQSVALENYSRKTELLLNNTQKYTLQLVNKGKINIGGKKLRIFIGSTLYFKNRISENLYIFDSPPITWEDEYLDKTDRALKNVFDLQTRTKNIQADIQIIRENLDFFINLMNQKKSFFLEWVVIILILIEVVNMIIEKVLNY